MVLLSVLVIVSSFCFANFGHSYFEIESEIQSYDFRIAKRTFKRDRDDICSLYGVDIRFDFSRKVYFIDCEEDSEANIRILESFDTVNALKISDQLSKHVYFEKRRPAGTENLYGLLHAIKHRFRVKFTYHKFWEELPSQRIGEPYALKEFKSRWYVLMKEQNSETIKSFALDRLTNLEVSRLTFEFPVNYNVEESYRYCFGIISPNELAPQEIILSFSPYQGKYIKTLPLHPNQEVLIENKSELRIKLHLCITHDLIMELLSFGAEMKVLQPPTLADEIKKAHKNAYKQY